MHSRMVVFTSCALAVSTLLLGPLAPNAGAACTFTDCDTPFVGDREALLATERVAGIEQALKNLLTQPFALRLTARNDGVAPGLRSTVVTRDGITRIVTIPAAKPHADLPPARITYLDATFRCSRRVTTTPRDAWLLLSPPKPSAIARDRRATWTCAKRSIGDLDAVATAIQLLPSAQVNQAPGDAWFVDYTTEPGFRPPAGLSLGLYWPGQWRAYTRDTSGGMAISSFTAVAFAESGQPANFAEVNATLTVGGVPPLPKLTGLTGFRKR